MNHTKKLITISTFLFAISPAWAQQSLTSNSDLNAMIETERAFAKMAKDQNTRDAFIFYMTDDVVTSGNDGPIIGKEGIKKQKIGNGWLHWNIAFSDISACGDLGFNTGPWEFRANKTDEKPVAFGEFNSIWKKQNDGTWKNVLDIGVGHDEGLPVDSIELTTSVVLDKEPQVRIKLNPSKEPMMDTERQFLSQSIMYRHATYMKFLSPEARIIQSNQLPIITAEAKKKFMEEGIEVSNAKLLTGEISKCLDMGYVYGTANVILESKGKKETKLATYFRVWKKEDGVWKIVLDVLSY